MCNERVIAIGGKIHSLGRSVCCKVYINHELHIHHQPPLRTGPKTRTKNQSNEQIVLEIKKLVDMLAAKSFQLPNVRFNFPFQDRYFPKVRRRHAGPHVTKV